MRVAITTLGCKANWADSEAISQALASAGIEIVPFDSEADAYVVNTCAVTAIAGAQSRQMLRRARKRAPGALVVAIGCYSEVDREDVRHIAGVDEVFGARESTALISFLCEKLGAKVQDIGNGALGPMPLAAQSRARAFLRIQDGCNRRCAYCIVPRARGRSRSLPVDEVVKACEKLSHAHREIILAGIDVGQYGRDLAKKPTLSSLVERLVEIKGMARIRVSSLDPKQIDDRLMDLMADGSKVCRHIHLSIQSASDSVLAWMSRGYRSRDIERVVSTLVRRVPQIAVTGDIIAGFPGETDAEHEETVSVIRGLPIAGLHVFPFSAREGTKAAAMKGQIDARVKKERAAELRALARKKRREYLSGLIGADFGVILTSRGLEADGNVIAVADNGVKISLLPGRASYGAIAQATITGLGGIDVKGTWE